MPKNKQFQAQFKKGQAKLEPLRERSQRRRFKDDPIRCDNCGTGIVIGEKCTSCGNLND